MGAGLSFSSRRYESGPGSGAPVFGKHLVTACIKSAILIDSSAAGPYFYDVTRYGEKKDKTLKFLQHYSAGPKIRWKN
jgi:hypothetical protein